MGTGLIVEELIGQGVNGVTGDYSRGAVGHWVENGEIQFPVHEVTIAGNLRELYQRIAAIGNDQDMRSGIRCGSLLVEEMTIAGAYAGIPTYPAGLQLSLIRICDARRRHDMPGCHRALRSPSHCGSRCDPVSPSSPHDGEDVIERDPRHVAPG